MGRYDPMKPGELRDVGRQEHILLQALYVLDSRMQDINMLKYRCAGTPGLWRDLRMMQVVMRKCLKQLLKTLPDVRLRQFDALRNHGKLNITIDPLDAHKEPGMMIVDIRDSNTVGYFACNSECSMCLKEGKEIKRCKLRQSLMNMMPPEHHCSIGCEYRYLIESLTELEEKKEAEETA